MSKKKINTNFIMKLYIDTKKASNRYIECHKSLKEYKKNKREFNTKSKNAIGDLKLLLAYLKKHNELKLVYSSYKEILKQMLNFKKKFEYLNHISKPRISETQLQYMSKQQDDLMANMTKLTKDIPDVSKLF